MTLEEIQKRLAEIKKKKDDDEVAHGLQDDLYVDFINFVAKRNDSLGQKAKLVLRVQKIDFYRWMA